MSQRQQLERIMEIDRQIRAARYPNAASLAKHFEVTERAIYMDREFMIDRLGAPIAFVREQGGWHYADPTWTLPNIQVTHGELMAFFLSAEVARRYLGTAFEEPLWSAVGKILRTLGERAPISLEALREVYTFAAPAAPDVDAALLADLATAIREHRQVRMRYFTASRGESSEREVNPCHLYNQRGDWYLFAYDHTRKEMRNFHLSRIEWLTVLQATFERNPSFRVEEYMSTAFQHERGEPQLIEIQFDAQQARYIRERPWHPTQEPLEEQADGGVILRFRAGGLGEVKRWVMQFGSHAVIRTPATLRRMVAEELSASAAHYPEFNVSAV